MYKKICPETGEVFYTPYPWQKYKNAKIGDRVGKRRSYDKNRGNKNSRHFRGLIRMREYNKNRRKKLKQLGFCPRCGSKIPEGTRTILCDTCIKQAGKK